MPKKLSNIQKNTSESYFTTDAEVIRDNTIIMVQHIRKIHQRVDTTGKTEKPSNVL